ncbi:MAG: AzlC family ABC transporter permease [Christensenellales bacterium]|jgi:4-azaleucine resistance transporter AzlC
MNTLKDKATFKQAFIDTLPVMSGYLIMGAGFGMVMNSYGYPPYLSTFMAVCIYAGAMQYVGANLLFTGASLFSVALTTFIVNARHIFYGLTMLEQYKEAGKEKPYLYFGLTDETYTLLSRPLSVKNKRAYRFYVTILNHSYWIAGCTLGALLGSAFPQVRGADFALTALFVVALVQSLEFHKRNDLPALIGAGATLLSLLIFGKDNFLLPAMGVIVVLLLILPERGTQA